ncbi:MAG: FtsX-like permease family protein, partial [Anaerolineae bacterium]
MNNIRHKIRHDLWANRARTLQVILIIGMGAFAIGMIVGTRDLVIDGISDIWQTTSPASIALSAMPPIDDETLDGLRRIEGVEDVEGFTTLTIEWRLHADKPWQPAGLTARDDYDDQRYSKLDLVSGAWPNEAVFAVEQGGDTAFGLPTGSEATIRVNDREYPIRIGGVVYNPVGMPPSFGGTAQFYTTRNRLGELTGSCSFNRILAGMTSYDEAGATDIASQMQRKLENQGVQSAGATVFMSRTADPVKHFFQDILDGVFLLLGVMAALALLLGLFLVYNTINAIISQQIDQIGVMKAIGATTGQILAAFLLTVFAYGVMALLIAIPLGIAGAWLLNGALLDFFNVAAGALRVSKTAVFIQIAIALLTPLLAALIPILSGARITVREAINSYGLSAGAGLLERWLARFERVSRLVLLTISNTFRHKGRVALTQISLILSGVIFMMVMGVRDSAQHTYSDVLASILRFDVNFSLAEPERIEPLTALTLTHPQVTAVELWQTSGETIHRTDTPASDDDERTLMFGVPLPTE